MRREWIEITGGDCVRKIVKRSPSMRREWIEIFLEIWYNIK